MTRMWTGLRAGALWALLVLLLLFLTAELVLWLLVPVSLYPTYRFTFQNDLERFGLRNETVYEMTTHGIRRWEGGEPERERSLRLLVLGGPIVYQPLQSAEDTWWGELGQGLQSALPDTDVTVLAKACASARRGDDVDTAMRAGVRWAKRHLVASEPDVVLVAFGLSEVLDVPGNYRYEAGRMATSAPDPGGFKDALVGASQIARRIRHRRTARAQEAQSEVVARKLESSNYFIKQADQQRLAFLAMPFDANPPKRRGERDPLPEFLEGLRVLQALSDQVEARFVVLGEPSFHDDAAGDLEMARLRRPRWDKFPLADGSGGVGVRPDPAWVEGEMNRYYQAAEVWSEKRRLPFLSLNDEWTLPKNVRHFMDESSLTDAGSERVATQVFELIEPLVR